MDSISKTIEWRIRLLLKNGCLNCDGDCEKSEIHNKNKKLKEIIDYLNDWDCLNDFLELDFNEEVDT